MEDLSLHVLDVAENALRAGAREIYIRLVEDLDRDLLSMEIEDDGPGMDEQMVKMAEDPFFTTRTTRKVGMGLAFLAESARAAQGDIEVRSRRGQGTLVRAWFRHGHIDRKPLGDMGSTLAALVSSEEGIRVRYEHIREGRRFYLDTKDIKREVDPLPLSHPQVLGWIKDYVNEGLREIGAAEGG